MSEPLPLNSDALATWQKAAAKSAPGGQVDALNWHTPEGLVVKPLYTAAVGGAGGGLAVHGASAPVDADVAALELRSGRTWDAHAHPWWLAFEVEGLIQVRPDQHMLIHTSLYAPGGVSQLSTSVGAQWDQPLANGDHLILRGDFHYESPVQIVEGLPGFLDAGTAVAIAAAQPYRREVNELHVEAGHKLNGSLLREGLVDELLLYVSPRLLGEGAGLAALGPFTALDQAPSYDFVDVQRVEIGRASCRERVSSPV